MNMIAKFKVTLAEPFIDETTKTTTLEKLEFSAVTEKPFDAEGASEDNSFSKWTPTGELKMTVTNPALFGKFEAGQTYYLTFTPAEA